MYTRHPIAVSGNNIAAPCGHEGCDQIVIYTRVSPSRPFVKARCLRGHVTTNRGVQLRPKHWQPTVHPQSQHEARARSQWVTDVIRAARALS